MSQKNILDRTLTIYHYQGMRQNAYLNLLIAVAQRKPCPLFSSLLFYKVDRKKELVSGILANLHFQNCHFILRAIL